MQTQRAPLGQLILLSSLIIVLMGSATGALKARERLLAPSSIPLKAAPPASQVLAGGLSEDGTRLVLVIACPITPATASSPRALRIELLDAGSLKPLVERELAGGLPPWFGWPPFYSGQLPFGYFVTFAPGGIILLPDRGPKIDVLRADTLEKLRSIDVHLAKDQPYYGPDIAEISPQGDRLAVTLTHFADPEHGAANLLGGGEVRVYSLETDELIWGTSFSNVGVKDIAWSPDGERLAVTLLTENPRLVVPHVIDNLRVLDARSGREMLETPVGFMQGPVCFGSHGQILTAPYFVVSQQPLKHQRIKVWDGRTGRFLREIGYPGRDVQGALEASSDGRVVVGYVGRMDSGFSWHGMEDEVRGWQEKLAVWDARDGKLLASTPDIHVRALEHTSAGTIVLAQDACARIALSADGSRALLYWPCLAAQVPGPLLFGLPEVPAHGAR